MTGIHDLQLFLRDTGRYQGEIDGDYGPATRAAALHAMEDGPDTPLTDADYLASSRRMALPESTIRAFAEVEACGAGFANGEPKILFEPHIFSRKTNGAFDQSHPHVSYPKWGMLPYPTTQDGRYGQLLEAIGLDPWAGFAACSYGKFQILGDNHRLCGYDTPWAFAVSQAYDEPTQLKAFEGFLQRSELLGPLRAGLWSEVAKRYNGPAYFKNKYDVKLAQADAAWRKRLGT
jgi:hypothetical protein